MSEDTATTLAGLAEKLAELAPHDAWDEAVAVAGQLGFEPREPAEGESSITIETGTQSLLFTRTDTVSLAVDELATLRALLKLGLARVAQDEELRRIREHMSLLSRASFEGLFWHVNGFILGANQRFSELTGYPPSEVYGKEVFNALLAPEDVPRVQERMAARFEGSYVVTCVRKDQTRFRAELQAKQGTWGERPVRLVAVRDVTERERMETLLSESEARLGQLAAASFEVIVYSRDGVMIDVTGAVEEMWGYKREEMVGRNVTEFVTAQFSERIGHMHATNTTGVYESAVRTKSGEMIPLEVVAVRTTLHGEPVRMAALRDVSAAKRQEQERRELELALERSQRLDSLGVLAGGIAHDFNNLLSAVNGYAELLEMQIKEPSLRDMARSIVEAGQRAASLTEQMLAYAGRREIGPRSPIDLSRLVSELQALLTASLSKKAQIRPSCEPDCVVLGSRATLTQVVLNLLTNASDALGANTGTITVRTRRLTQLDERWARALHRTAGEGQWVLLEVSDTGVGMDEPTKARIFEPFFSTKAKGHGLGLAACIGIVASHGGAILVDSKVGEGSTFSVLLPAEGRPVSPAHEPASPPQLAGKVVLVADDEPLVRTHLSEALRAQGCEVHEANGGEAALRILAGTTLHLVLIDMTMPDLSGIDVLRRMRAEGSRVPVILTSGYHDVSLDQEASGFQAFLAKPYTLSDLFGAVEQALHG